MIHYPYLLFDADDTLFDFGAANARAFHAVCRECEIPDTPENFALYESCNNALWHAFDRGEVTKDFLVVERFRLFLAKIGLNRDPHRCNAAHLAALSQGHQLLPHALEVCRTLSGYCSLYIVTNAVAAVQRSRLAASAIRPYVKGAFISEEAGAAKPSIEYFNYVFSQVPELAREDCLLVGDSLSSDIRGANNAGIAACWYNPKGAVNRDGLRIDYEIRDLRQLYEIVGIPII
jgi:2-haloacid dehalogenase